MQLPTSHPQRPEQSLDRSALLKLLLYDAHIGCVCSSPARPPAAAKLSFDPCIVRAWCHARSDVDFTCCVYYLTCVHAERRQIRVSATEDNVDFDKVLSDIAEKVG